MYIFLCEMSESAEYKSAVHRNVDRFKVIEHH